MRRMLSTLYFLMTAAFLFLFTGPWSFAAKNLRKTLEAGVTTVRDVGGVRDITNSLKQALSMKLISGPRFSTRNHTCLC